jgi:anti-sigma factor RsiW
MNCAHCRRLLDANGDGELDAATARDVSTHLVGCSACSALQGERERLATLVRTAATPFKTPAGLSRRIQSSLQRPTVPLSRRPTWINAALLAAAAGGIGLAVGLRIASPGAEDAMSDSIVAAHVASSRMAPDVTQIHSSDRHQIKPWFAGRVAFAPLVVDLRAEGFDLVGARLDQVGDRPAAVVVYRIRNHFLNVLMWRSERPDAVALRFRTLRGFAAATWTSGGVSYAAISDVEPTDLKRLAQRLVAAVETAP